MENTFTPIDKLIFAPISAIKEADISLSNGILNQIAIFSDTNNKNADTVEMKLKNIKFLYEKIKAGETEEIIETVGLTVPAASIVPLSALHINSSVIKFNIEVKSEYNENNSFYLIGKNAPEKIRKTDFLPKMHFKIKTEAAAIPEGVARLIDQLDASQVPSVERKVYVNSDGIPYKNQDIYINKNNVINEINKLNIMINKIDKYIISLEKKLISETKISYNDYFKSKYKTPDGDKLYEGISYFKGNLNKYLEIKADKEKELLNIEMTILEDNISYDEQK